MCDDFICRISARANETLDHSEITKRESRFIPQYYLHFVHQHIVRDRLYRELVLDNYEKNSRINMR